MAISSAGQHLRLAVQVLDAVKEEILSGALAPDSQLSEADLSQHLGVSRTPVREALIKLAEDGLVKIVPQVGTFVAPISFAQVSEAQFIREHLECALILDTAQRMDEQDLRALRDNLDQQALAARDEDWGKFHGLDEALHAALASISGHLQAWRVILQSKVQMDRVRRVSVRMPEHMAKLIKQHTAVVDALAEGDGLLAQASLRGHLREVFKTMERLGLSEATETPPQRKKRQARV